MKEHPVEKQNGVGRDFFSRQINGCVDAVIEDGAFDAPRPSGTKRREKIANDEIELERVPIISLRRLAAQFVTLRARPMKPVDRSANDRTSLSGERCHELICEPGFPGGIDAIDPDPDRMPEVNASKRSAETIYKLLARRRVHSWKLPGKDIPPQVAMPLKIFARFKKQA